MLHAALQFKVGLKYWPAVAGAKLVGIVSVATVAVATVAATAISANVVVGLDYYLALHFKDDLICWGDFFSAFLLSFFAAGLIFARNFFLFDVFFWKQFFTSVLKKVVFCVSGDMCE